MDILSTAIKWRKQGISCLPCYPNSKFLLKGTRLDDYKNSLIELPTLIKRFYQTPFNIAVFPSYSEVTQRHLVILDFDLLPSWCRWQSDTGIKTLTTTTKRGKHSYFWCEQKPDKSLRCENETIEIKFHLPVLIPPSRVDGKEYISNDLPVMEVEKIESVIACYSPPSSAFQREKKKQADLHFSSFTLQCAEGANNNIFTSIKRSLTMLDYLSNFSDVPPTYKFVSCFCPFHADNGRPSLSVNTQLNLCKCFKPSCKISHKWLDVIGLHGNLNGLGNKDAADDLVENFCI